MERIKYIQNCEIKVVKKNEMCEIKPIKNVNFFDNYLYIDHKFFRSHSHFLTDVLFQLSYYFFIIKEIKQVKLIVTHKHVFQDFFDILKIPYLILGKHKIVKCKVLFYIDNAFDYEHDISLNGNLCFDDKYFFYRRLISNDTYICSIDNMKYNIYDDLIFIVNKIIDNMTFSSDNIKNIYVSRLKDSKQWYYMENISEISELIERQDITVLSPFSKFTIREKINFVYNCNLLLIENCSALFYALFAKPSTRIIILTSPITYYYNINIINAVKNKFPNMEIIKGYDIYKEKPYSNTYYVFYFNDEEKILSIMPNRFQLFTKYNIYINNTYKIVNVYEYINLDISNSVTKNKIYTDIAGNDISLRFLVPENEYVNIQSISKINNIECYPIKFDIWEMNNYMIYPQSISTIV